MSFEDYSKQVPKEIKKAVSSIDDEKRWGIFIALLKNGEMKINELEKETGISKDKLKDNLKELQKGALVSSFYKNSIDTENTYYEVTEFGGSFINGLLSSLI